MLRPIFVCCSVFLYVAANAAEPDSNAPKRFNLTPKAAPARPLQYPLLPEVAEQTSGNAVTFYKKAFAGVKSAAGDQDTRNEVQESIKQYLETPLKDFPCEAVRVLLKPYAEVFKEIETGARAEYCDWEITERLRQSGIGAAIPEIGEMRELAYFLSVRARMELADGKPDQAIRTLRTGLALGRHLADCPLLISYLVSMAINGTMLDRLEEVIQHEKAPNLYWSLTTLPSAIIDMRKPFQGERLSVYGSLPGIRDIMTDLNAGPLDAKVLREAGKVVDAFESDNADLFGLFSLLNRVVTAKAIVAKHETAKKALLEMGRPREKLEAMPHVQIAILHSLLQYDRLMDEIMKWQAFPYWEAKERLQVGFKRQKAELDGATADSPAIPLAKLLLPAVEKVLVSRVRIERRIAALRTLEAIRLYAAAHDGQLPPTLNDVKDVPMPIDPFTGKSFNYQRIGDKATLTSPALQPERTYVGNAIAYEISLRK